jgi:hypothetical protein
MGKNLRQFFKQHCSPAEIKMAIANGYKKAADAIKGWAKRENTKVYWGFTWRVLKRLWDAISQSFVSFGAAVTFLYLVWGLSLLIKGESATMTLEFESNWLIIAAAVGLVFFVSLLISGIITSINDFIETRNRLRSSHTESDSEKFVTVADFEQFKEEVNKKLDDLIKNKRE